MAKWPTKSGPTKSGSPKEPSPKAEKPKPRATGRKPKEPKANPAGRPKGTGTKVDKGLLDALTLALIAGATIGDACHYAGIHPNTYTNWMKRGKAEADRIASEKSKRKTPLDGEADYYNAYMAVERAKANMRIRALTVIQNAADPPEEDGKPRRKPEWKAAAWLLERTDPANYGRRVVDNNLQGDINIRVIREEQPPEAPQEYDEDDE